MVYGRSPSWTASSTPVTVTVWGVLQSDAVKGRLDGAEVPSAASLEATATATSAVGWLVSTTVNVAVPPASVLTSPAAGGAVVPAALLWVCVPATSAGSCPA